MSLTINRKALTTPLFALLIACMAAIASHSAYAGKGWVKIITDPGKAKIYVNGKRKGTSPAKKGQTFAIKLLEGEYTIKAVIEESDYFELHGSEEVYVAEDTIQTIEIQVDNNVATQDGKAKGQSALSDIAQSMVTIPAGSFRMGCVSGKDCHDSEKPVHTVNVSAFALQQTEVTFAQWDACVALGPCHKPDDKGWGRGNRPVINVSWDDAQVFIKWLNSVTAGGYRLPTEAEWEYAARAGSQTKYSWGNNIGSNRANCYSCGSQWDDSKTAPVASFAANALGLYDMHGNVWEWTHDCWNNSYKGAPSNGSAWLSGDCGWRAVRGGSWTHSPKFLRSAGRYWYISDDRFFNRGFRLAQDL